LIYTKFLPGYIEDFEYVVENNLKVDRLWYLENQCTSNIELLFKPLMDDPKKLIHSAIEEQKRRQFGMKKGTTIKDQMMSLFEPRAKKQKVETKSVLKRDDDPMDEEIL
jgi:hypothetical protein